MYGLDDVAALMQSVMDESDGHQVALYSEHAVACTQYEFDGWLNQRLSATGSAALPSSNAGGDDSSLQGCGSLRSSSGRLFDEPDAVQARSL